MQVKLKCPKENQTGKAVIVELYETKGTLCPVKAFERWHARAAVAEDLPLFRDSNGHPVTGKFMNKWLKARLSKFVNYEEGKYSSHSFRIGLASTMAEKGTSTQDIMEAGRWSSKAYESYVKLPQTKRAAAARTIRDIVMQVKEWKQLKIKGVLLDSIVCSVSVL